MRGACGPERTATRSWPIRIASTAFPFGGAAKGRWSRPHRRVKPRSFSIAPQLSAVYSQTKMAVETEIKFRVLDVSGLTSRLQAAGFSLQRSEEHTSELQSLRHL